MKVVGGGVLKQDSLEFLYESVRLPLLAALILALGLGFNLNLGVLILDRSCLWERLAGEEADSFLSTLVAKRWLPSREDILVSYNGSSILDSSSREEERPAVDGKVRARSILMSPVRKLRLFLFLLSLENSMLASEICDTRDADAGLSTSW